MLALIQISASGMTDVHVEGTGNVVAGNDVDVSSLSVGGGSVSSPTAASSHTAPASAAPSSPAAGEAEAGAPLIKSSSLSYANAAGRVGFDFKKFYNDFTNEGHMYPVHGVGDIDTTAGLMASFVKSAQGEVFGITDLDIDIKVTDPSLTKENCFFDFHAIPTKYLDGSTKFPDGSRVETKIPYFNGKVSTSDPLAMKIDWISGEAKFASPASAATVDGFASLASKTFPTTLASTRATPFLADDEHLALTFFADGKQARLTNGGTVSNWRYVVPLGVGKPIAWFVAKAHVPCDDGESGCVAVTTTNGKSVMARPRTSAETEDLASISYNKVRIMETVSDVVEIKAATRAAAFNQRYGDKCVDFGDIIMKATPADDTLTLTDPVYVDLAAGLASLYTKYESDKQLAFGEMLKLIKKMDGTGAFVLPSIYDTAAMAADTLTFLSWFIAKYLKSDTYNISPKALVSKITKAPGYMWSPVCETGWLVVEEEKELAVPSEEGEFFIGWVIETQPMYEPESTDSMIDRAIVKKETINFATTNGYALHQGPGLIYQTCGDFAHIGTQEPYLLDFNYAPVKQAAETDAKFALRTKEQLPAVHWRLDAPSVIHKSKTLGAFTEANVGAGQMALASIGTKTPASLPSKSKNFLGRCYQDLLFNRTKIQKMQDGDYEKLVGEVYSVIGGSGGSGFVYGEQQSSPANQENCALVRSGAYSASGYPTAA